MAGFLVRHSRWFLAACVFVGVALPSVSAALFPFLPPAVVGLLILSLLRMDWGQVRVLGKRPGIVVLALAWILAGAPLVMAAMVEVLAVGPGVAAGLVLMAASAPLMSAPALAVLIGLDGTLAVVLVVAATLLLPVTAPILTDALAGLPLPAADLMLRLGVTVGGSVAGALVLRRVIGRARLAAWAPRIDALSVLFLIFFAVAIMQGVRPALAEAPLRTLLIVLGAFAANAGLQLAGALIFWWSGRARALTIGLVGGNCNMALLLAVLPADVHPDVPLYFALGQFPIYLLPALLTPVYRRVAFRGCTPPAGE